MLIDLQDKMFSSPLIVAYTGPVRYIRPFERPSDATFMLNHAMAYVFKTEGDSIGIPAGLSIANALAQVGWRGL